MDEKDGKIVKEGFVYVLKENTSNYYKVGKAIDYLYR